MPYEHKVFKVIENGVRCDKRGSACGGWYKITDTARAAIGTACRCGGVMREYIEEVEYIHKIMICSGCGQNEDKCDVEERYSLGIYAGHYCTACWDRSGYRKDGPEGYDYLDAGEYYDDDY